MWFGSYEGLHKHEGTFIKVYAKSGRDSLSLSSKEMHAVFEDRLGFIWVGTTGGLDRLDPKTGLTRHFILRASDKKDNNLGYIVSIFQDNNDAIWVASDAGLFILDYKTGEYVQVPDNDRTAKGIPHINLLYKSTVKTEAGIWIYSAGYMVFYDFKKKCFFHQYNNPEHKAIFNLRGDRAFVSGSELCTDSSNNLYFVFSDSVLMKYNCRTEKLDSFRFTFPQNAWTCCYSLAADHKGNVWIGFRFGGVLLFDQHSRQFTPIRFEGVNSLVQSDYVYSLCEDYLQRMWVTTDKGVFVIDYYNNTVQQTYLSDKKEFANSNYASGIISGDEKGNIYVPYYAKGLFQYNIYNGISRHFPITAPGIKKYDYVTTDKEGVTYVSSNGVLMKAQIAGSRLTLELPATNKYGYLSGDPARMGWIFSRNENDIYFKKQNGIIYHYNGSQEPERIVSTGFSKQACISRDSNYLLFLNSNNDLVKRNLVTAKTETFLLNEKLAALNFSYANTRDIADDGYGNVWITSQNGLIRYTMKDGNVTIYTTADGLLHDFSFSLCVDSKQRLWVGSMGGVSLFDARTNTFTDVFSELPDKLNNYFGSSLEGKDGHMYFFLGGKMVNIDPEGFSNRSKLERSLRLNEIRVNETTVTNTENVLAHLTHRQNNIYFRFGVLEFAAPEKVKYYYQLIGFNKNWISLGNHAEISFNSLSAGHYTLNVKATDALGNTVKEQLSIPFIINPPVWKTWWFILLTAVCIALLIFWVIKWREKQIRAVAAAKLKVQQLNAEKYKNKLELEQVINYFSGSLIDKHTVDEVVWDVAKNLIGQLGFVDCMIYLWNEDKTKMIQKAGHGLKDSAEELSRQSFDVQPGQGVVGYVMQTKEAVIIADTSKDNRYRPDDISRFSEITVPITYNDELIGILDSEHPDKSFFTQRHLQILTTIATLMANKIRSVESEELLLLKNLEMYSVNEQLSKAKLEALRSQMNPHFIFNCLNAIQECILTNKVDAAYTYLSKFSKLQRMVLNNSQHELISLSSEMEMLQLYLSLESLRFSDSFSYTINTKGVVFINEIMIPSLITQPLVENAIWHGLRNKDGEKTLSIVYEEKDAKIFITIDDNGIGREKAAAMQKQKLGSDQFASRGTIMLQQRLQVLSKQLKADIELKITDKPEDAGTEIIISFPSNLETL
jgi:ligand-binding sensor domain-containing protein/putative methionine-R-sulfoxide reductase with GAF domain/two-component sensor histidine kinase